MKLIILLRCKCVLSQHLSHLELEGQLKMLKLVPKVSPSSRVLGRCLNNVSGRNRAVWKRWIQDKEVKQKGTYNATKA